MEIDRRQLLAGLAGAGLSAGCRCSLGPRRPNVLLLFPDQLRASALSAHSSEAPPTPTMDALLAQSMSFSRAFAPIPLCSPARATLLTGIHPLALELTGNFQPLPAGTTTLAHRLTSAGYRCGFIGKWHLFRKDSKPPSFVPEGYRGGFDDFWAARNYSDTYRGGFYYRDAAEPIRFEPKDRLEALCQNDLLREFASAEDDRPFFAAVGYSPPHPDGPSGSADWTQVLSAEELSAIDRASIPRGPNVDPDEAWTAYMHGYFAATRVTDGIIGHALKVLDDLGIRGNTLVVFTSDHGEGGGAHGTWGKSTWWDESVRVPLGFSWPGMITPRKTSIPVSLTDVVPTVLGMLELDQQGLHGTDLSPWLLGGRRDRPEVLLAGKLGGPKEWHGLVRGRWKYVRTRKREQFLYDTEADPHEMTSVHTREAALTRELRTALRDRLAAL